MISNLEDYSKYLFCNHMSGDQFLFCCLVHEKRYDLIKMVFSGKEGFRKEVEQLEKRGYVRKEGNTYYTTDKFNIYGDEYALWTEFIDTYPQFIYIEQKRIPAQSCDLESLKSTYFLKIGKDRLKHNQIIDLINYAKEHDLISMGIEKFVKGEQWKAIDAIRKSDDLKYGEREF